MPDHSSSNTKQLIFKALSKVLSALVRLVVRQGITYPELTELLKRAYVEEVQKDLKHNAERVTLSRISIVSGVHRKDVKRLTEIESEHPFHEFEKVSLTSRLVSLWMGDSQYIDDKGDPLPLPKSGEKSFESLVRSVSSDIRPRTILDEWLQQGLIYQQTERFCLNINALFPSEDIATKVAFFARNTSDHISACEHNLRGTLPPFPERSVFYNRLSKDSVQQLQTLASNESQTLIVKVNKLAQTLAKQDDASTEKTNHRFILGTYFYRKEEESDD